MQVIKGLQILLLLLVINLSCFCQSKRAWHWYFGHEAGLDFTSGAAVADLNGKLISIEGSAAISDTNGNLLFYTNGVIVWNKNHVVMDNGSDLLGDNSAAQSSLIVPLPESNSLYYLFAPSASPYVPTGMRYSIIDIRLNAGLGAVTSVKNVLLYSLGTEEIAGTMHCNAKDYWIVGRECMTDTIKFHAYLLTKNGITSEVITKLYLPNQITTTVGGLSFSPDGKLLAFGTFRTPLCLYDFNKESGVITNKVLLPGRTNEHIYSQAFSGDGKKLYVSSVISPLGYNIVSQYDLMASDIAGSRAYLDSVDFSFGSPNGYPFIGQIRLAPDQKIYVSRWKENLPYQVHPSTFYSLDSIDVIHSPNSAGLACNFQRNALYLNHKPTMLGLPNFVSNFTSGTTTVADCSTVVPVTFKNFSVTKKKKESLLSWQTEMEQNVKNFAVQWKTSTGIFSTQEILPAANRATGSQYNYVHAGPAKGINYYRIKTTDFDGRFSYSEIRAINFDSDNLLEIMPNPASNEIWCKLQQQLNTKAIIRIYDQTGRVVLVKNIITSGQGINEKIDIDQLNSGTYVLSVCTSANVYEALFVKN